jgi:hypothetical protein
MKDGMNQAATAEMINKFAHILKIWCISLECHVGKGTERVWWFKRPDEDYFTRRSLTDGQAIKLTFPHL